MEIGVLGPVLVRALTADGYRGRALEVFDGVRRALRDQLGVDPSAELTGLHRELLTGRRGDLPAEVSGFIGDAGVLDEVLGGHRLVTLTGPGGSGKTRLSVEVGARLPGEVWLVELASVRDPAELRVLATCREPLGITGERLFPVEPLALPPVDAGPESAARAPAVRLLLDRASGFTLTRDNTPAAVRVPGDGAQHGRAGRGERAEVTRAGAHAALGDVGFAEAYRRGAGVTMVSAAAAAEEGLARDR